MKDDLRDKMAIALAKRRFWNYDGSKPIPEDAVYDADALCVLIERECVERERAAYKKGWLNNYMERPGDDYSRVKKWAEKRAVEAYSLPNET